MFNVGDPMPNTDGHIHLEKQLKKGIWEEYVGDFEYRGRRTMSYDAFCVLWRDSFPHVKIRAFKQVSGIKWCNYKMFVKLFCGMIYHCVLFSLLN
jgi:hypothetical protein